ncbi:Kelch repeat-containing protein [Flavobacterium algicola]|uniref:Kelch repeat-containing protein n=1 Tax=Flavobacterium algicola TaxID=556529 RepID=UPI001EFE1BF8|nr:kelch repeat-containing protein [Flavobacterium algicola]MCG9792851.1 galactose oxidase [Flavobacterium algicola]
MKNNMISFSKIIGLLLFTLFCQQATSQSLDSYKWETMNCTGEPVARHEAAFIEVGGKFYLMGGRRIQEVSIFNPATNTWTSGAKPPIELHHFQGFSYKRKIYIIGAHTGPYPHETPVGEAYIYDPVKDSWEKGFSMPENRLRASTTANIFKNKLYISGGIIDGHWDGHVNWLDVYDFKTGKWEVLQDAPRPRDHATSVICKDKLYVLGGRVSSGKIKKVFELTIPEVDVYDFKTGKWSTLEKPVPTQRAGCTSICIGDKILFTGGENVDQLNAHNEVEVLDTKTGTWSTLPSLIQGRHGTQLIWYKKKLYIASGCGQRGGNPELKSIERFSSSLQK